VQREVAACKGTGSSLLLRGELLFIRGSDAQSVAFQHTKGKEILQATAIFDRTELEYPLPYSMFAMVFHRVGLS
jgi:hypothetical protein